MAAGNDISMTIDIEGHRGARGLRPENSLPAFACALSLGVTTLELDVGVTRDGVVVVMHDRALNPSIVRDVSGQWLKAQGQSLHSLSFAELSLYDIGRINPRSDYAYEFPRQKPFDGTRVPSLGDVFDLTKKAGNEIVEFNIETKISARFPEDTLPADEFVDALLKVVWQYGLESRVIIQSFEWKTLSYVQQVAPTIRTSYLSAQQTWFDNIRADPGQVSPWTDGFDVEQYDGSLPATVAAAGGEIWSPYYREVDEENLHEAHACGLRVIVWTVNDALEMNRLIELGVDGIISDYPDQLRKVLIDKNFTLPEATPVSP